MYDKIIQNISKGSVLLLFQYEGLAVRNVSDVFTDSDSVNQRLKIVIMNLN